MARAVFKVSEMTIDEQLKLLDEIWDSLSRKPEALPLTAAQEEELDRRLDDLERDGALGIPWDEVFHRIRKSKR
ncbi:MAG: addiction module protein [Planctomycetes bacterium]|nr:addiction module protein [Planctomycetota bacterium]